MKMMATRARAFAVIAARSCALSVLLLLFLAGSFPRARSSSETDVAMSQHRSTSIPASEGPRGRSVAAASISELGATEILIDGEVRSMEEQCFEVCCWQGDPACPYPYCNYNQGPCSGGK